MKIKVRFTDQPFGFNPENNCYIRALQRRFEVEFSDQPDFVFYSAFGTEFLKYPNSVRIFLANEPVLPNFNDCDYAIGAAGLTFGDRYLQQPPLTGYGEDPYWKHIDAPIPVDAFDRKFCNFVYSNAINGHGAKLRIDFCRMLQNYRPVDCPGQVLHNMSKGIEQRYYSRAKDKPSDFNDDWAEAKLCFIRDYKFTIAFENVSDSGWTTEKLIHPLMARSIPIYWGNPEAGRYFNRKAFIHRADYDNDFRAVIERVKELDQDEDCYMEMLSQPRLTAEFPRNWERKLEDFLTEIVLRGKPFVKNPMGFETMGTHDYHTLCAEGKVGMRKILKTTCEGVAGWMHYKLKK